MVKASVKTITYTSGSRKTAAARRSVAKASQLLRARMGTTTRAPLATRGFYGVYNRRGRDELKFVDTVTSAAGTAAGAVTLLNGVAQGTDYNQRIGRKFTMKSIMCRFGISYGTGAAVNSVGNIVRVLIFYDCQTNLNTPAVTDVLQTASYLSPMNLNNRDRFKIISDKWWSTEAFVITASQIDTGDFEPKIEKFYKKINLETQNGGTGATVGSISTGGVFLLIITGGNGNQIDIYTRVRYTDS